MAATYSLRAQSQATKENCLPVRLKETATRRDRRAAARGVGRILFRWLGFRFHLIDGRCRGSM
jgi:hypothetical protein